MDGRCVAARCEALKSLLRAISSTVNLCRHPTPELHVHRRKKGLRLTRGIVAPAPGSPSADRKKE